MMKRNLYNGVAIPAIGFGPGIVGYSTRTRLTPAVQKSLIYRVWNKLVGSPYARYRYIRAICSAFECGFRLLDYSAAYGNYDLILNCLKKTGLQSGDVFLTGRISNHAQFGGRAKVMDQIDTILRGFQTKQVDVLMFHWPVTGCYEETWRCICEAYEQGKARSIGVANCHLHHIERLKKIGLKPMLNQIEVHPLFTQKELIAYCQRQQILVESYSPIARYDDRLMRLPALHKIAENHSKSAVQIILRWHLQNECVPVIRSLNAQRQRQNLNIFDFELSASEMKTIDSFNINARIRYDPDNCDFTIL